MMKQMGLDPSMLKMMGMDPSMMMHWPYWGTCKPCRCQCWQACPKPRMNTSRTSKDEHDEHDEPDDEHDGPLGSKQRPNVPTRGV